MLAGQRGDCVFSGVPKVQNALERGIKNKTDARETGI